MPKYNGHKNWNHWNVSLWINNDEGLYRQAKACIEETMNPDSTAHRRNGYGPRESAAILMLEQLHSASAYKTPDGAPYSVSSIRAAMIGM